MEKFADILKDLITESELSLRSLATKSNVSAKQYSEYLRGTFPKLDVAVRIANFFNISLDYLFGIVDYELCYRKNYNMAGFVERYENLLKANNTTNWKFCKKTGMSESSLRRWKAGDQPNMHNLIIIAVYLSTSIDYLIGRE